MQRSHHIIIDSSNKTRTSAKYTTSHSNSSRVVLISYTASYKCGEPLITGEKYLPDCMSTFFINCILKPPVLMFCFDNLLAAKFFHRYHNSQYKFIQISIPEYSNEMPKTLNQTVQFQVVIMGVEIFSLKILMSCIVLRGRNIFYFSLCNVHA